MICQLATESSQRPILHLRRSLVWQSGGVKCGKPHPHSFLETLTFRLIYFEGSRSKYLYLPLRISKGPEVSVSIHPYLEGSRSKYLYSPLKFLESTVHLLVIDLSLPSSTYLSSDLVSFSYNSCFSNVFFK